MRKRRQIVSALRRAKRAGIFEAVNSGDSEQLLKHISDANSVDEKGNTALMMAASKGSCDMIKVLLAHDADINATNKDHESALTLAATCGNLASVQALLTAGACTNQRNSEGKEPLMIATNVGLELVAMLLDHGANINGRDKRGYTALMEACHFGNSATVRLLLERGADLNVVAEAGDDALIIAAWGGWDDIVSLLVQRGAKLNQYTTKARNTALTWAIIKCKHKTVKLLIDAGADPDHEPIRNKSVSSESESDPLMVRLIESYQHGGSPSWLVQELSARGLPWCTICEVEDALKEEGCTTREAFINTPAELLTHEYLTDIGISGLWVRLALLDLHEQNMLC